MPHLIECTYKDIEALTDFHLTQLLKKLLYLEVRAFGIAASGAYASLNINVPDGGEDGRVEWQDGPERTNWIPGRLCLYQCKATDMSKEECKQEILKKASNEIKPRVKEVLDRGGTYILFYGRDCNTEHQIPRIEKIREGIRESGAVYADTSNIEIFDANKIADWANHYLPAIILVARCVGKPIPAGVENWDSWARFPFARFRYVPGDPARDSALVQLRSHFSGGPRRIARFVGLSGLGKTRLALEIFRPPEHSEDNLAQQMLCDQVAYLDAETSGQEVLLDVQSWRSESKSGVLVVDNCDQRLHQKLVEHVQHQDSQLNLLTISPDPEPTSQSTEGVPLILLGPACDDVIREMLKQDYGLLPDADLDFIVKELARGFPQMAVLIAEARQGNRDLKGVVGDELLRRLLGVPNDAESPAFRVISSCSLFDHLGVWNDVAGQYKWVATFADIDKEKYYQHIKQFLQRGVLSKHGNFVQVRPAPLAMRLAADWWSRCSPETASRLIEGDIPEKLAEALCDRLRVLDYVPEVQEFVTDLCGPQRPFGQAKVLNSELGSRLFRSFVEVNPRATARAVAKAFEGWSIDDLLNVGPGRRNLVWALQNLCFWKDTFPTAAKFLLHLAAAENESWSNNATGIFLGFFKLVLSGTEAEPPARFQLADYALAHEDDRCRLLGVRALGSALRTGQFIGMRGPEQQGSRFPREEWRPKLYKDAFEYWAAALSRLTRIALEDDELSLLAQNEIAGQIRGLVLAGRVDDLDKAVAPIAAKLGGFWPKALDEVQTCIRHDLPGLPPKGQEMLNKWFDLLQPQSFGQRLRLRVSEAPWDHEQDASGNFIDVAAKNAETLAEECVQRIDDFLPYLPQILRGSQRQGFAFGYRVGQLAPEPRKIIDAALSALENIDSKEANGIVLGGILAGVQVRDSALVADTLNRASASEILRPHLVGLTRAIRLKEDDLDRIVALALAGKLPLSDLQGLSYGRALDAINPAKVSAISEQLSTLGVEGTWIALGVLFMYTHGSPEKWETCRPTYRRLLMTSNMLLAKGSKQSLDTHGYQVVAEKLLQQNDPELAAHLADEIVTVCGAERTRFDLDHVLAHIIDRLLTDYMEIAWPKFAEVLARERDVTAFYLSHLLGSRFGMGSEPGLIRKLPDGYLLDWCAKDPRRFPAILAGMVQLVAEVENQPPRLTDLVIELLNKYGDDEALLSALASNMGSFSWTGSLVPYYQRHVQLLSPLLLHSRQKVRDWAARHIEYAQRQAHRERDRDEEHDIGIY